MRTVYSGLVDEKFIGQTVTLYGWAHRRRDHGGVIFIDLRDREGLVQVVCDPDRPEVFATADKVRNEYCLKVVGLVRAAWKCSATTLKFSIPRCRLRSSSTTTL